MLSLFRKLKPGEAKIYPLYDMATLPTYVKGRLALIGDAAHPFTPHLAQGGAQAFEDGVAMGAMLEKGTSAAEIPERLKLYEKARYERSKKMQALSRVVGGDRLAAEDEMENKLSGKPEFVEIIL